ncbi:hypothetical protein F5148DRAFT_1283359 [Russula earlei]|uniref:Uncharacterized protein n=1 Tax=Russula earlei TaxID=71964 RepID=A0ACC0UBL1_9AGAM|nr:hypothetical protein F5148DRAFT_1283359 [Russula earlei]
MRLGHPSRNYHRNRYRSSTAADLPPRTARALRADSPGAVAVDNNAEDLTGTGTGTSAGGTPTSVVPVPGASARPSEAPIAVRASGAQNVALATCGAVGGVMLLAIISALVYVFRIRRRVKRMTRCTDILGPELVPTSAASQSSRLTMDSLGPHARLDGAQILPPPTPYRTKSQLVPGGAPAPSAPFPSANPVDRLHRVPLSPIRRSTIVVGPPPPARRAPIRFASGESRGPTVRPSSPHDETVPWPTILSSRSRHYPPHDRGDDDDDEESVSSDSSHTLTEF